MAEKTNNVTEILKAVVGELRDISRSETIMGEPVTIGSRTVIPIVKISVGFGAGGGQGEGNKIGEGFGGGGGGGARIEPAAFIIMDDDGVSLLPATKGSWESLIDAIPGIAKKISKVTKKFTKKSEKDSDLEDSEDS